MAIKNAGDPRFGQDESGQWWLTNTKSGNRARATVRQCPVCGEDYLSCDARSKTCSHECGTAYMHQQKPVTTAPENPVTLVHSDNPLFSQDAAGQWWYVPGKNNIKKRTRAYIKQCKRCNVDYLTSIFHKKKNMGFCSRKCALRTVSEANPDRFKGEKGSNWQGGRRKTASGYIEVWCENHPSRANTSKPYVAEHRLVMEKSIGRYLTEEETVHHKNGIKDDNRLDNLELWTKSHPYGQRVEDLVQWAIELLKLYAPDRLA